MARRARMGRRPSVQQNIGGTLIAIAREMQSRRDSNIMDAWKNGGEFEGKPVTDDMALAYWSGRQKNLNKKDPQYDTIQNQIMQLTYGIEQSKADLAHVQGKMSDQAYAQFFIKWAGKVPKNGEFWRVLQKNAATLIESSKAKARANADRAKQEAFNAFVEDKNKDINVANALTKAIQDMSATTGLDVQANGDRLLELLGIEYGKDPAKFALLQDALKANPGGFAGTFTHDWVANRLNEAGDAYDAVATRANKDGYASAYAQASQGQSEMALWGSDLKVWSPAQVYDKAYGVFQKVWGDPNASYRDKAEAAKVFSGVATKLSKTPGISVGAAQMFAADAARALGQDAGDVPSFGPAMLGSGHAGIDPIIQQTVAVTNEAQALMDATPGAYVYASMTSDGQFDPTGKAPVGIIAAGAMPPDAVFVAVPGLNGKPSMVAVQPHDVVVNDPNDSKANPTTIGKVISYQSGGKTITMYGYQDSAGNAGWTLRSPYAEGVQGATDKSGNLVLTLPGQANAAARAAQIDAKYGTDLAKQMTAGVGAASAVKTEYDPATKKAIGKTTVKWDGSGFSVTTSQFTIDPITRQTIEGNTSVIPISTNGPMDLLAAVMAPSVTAGGVRDGYLSPVAASVGASAAQMDSGQIATLAQDPAFQHAFVQKTMEALGITNPFDPRVVNAWSSMTAKASGENASAFGDPSSIAARSRVDLSYPGAAAAGDPTKTTGTIGFAGRELKLPGLPAYMNQMTPGAAGPNIDLNGVSDFLGGSSRFGQSVLQPGQAPGMPAGPAAPTSMGGFNPAPVTPTAVSTVASPTPLAAVGVGVGGPTPLNGGQVARPTLGPIAS